MTRISEPVELQAGSNEFRHPLHHLGNRQFVVVQSSGNEPVLVVDVPTEPHPAQEAPFEVSVHSCSLAIQALVHRATGHREVADAVILHLATGALNANVARTDGRKVLLVAEVELPEALLLTIAEAQ